MKRYFLSEENARAAGGAVTRMRDVGPLPPASVEDWQGRPEDAAAPQYWGTLWCVDVPERATVGLSEAVAAVSSPQPTPAPEPAKFPKKMVKKHG